MMQLNYRVRIPTSISQGNPIVMIHGLFGDLSNLNIIAENLAQLYYVVQIDMRNHGRSPHEWSMSYSVMVEDVIKLLDKLSIRKCIVIGFSMGGKVAMQLSLLAPCRVSRIIIIDIAPIKYDNHMHDDIFHAIECVNISGVISRIDAQHIMQKELYDLHMVLFLLKYFCQGFWRFNFLSIRDNYHYISDWDIHQLWRGPALFIKGALSTYIKDCDIKYIYRQFPKAQICTVPNAKHWVHRDNPSYLLDKINKFIIS
ncbi:alpha/beta fold hydrolase [Candidatus Blochmannia ocreatus (nom. nud.)]|uniref:Alpha/beta fold hydrolase n=1 Tax=Candidatus Blochmannia ocreatus (nom. nud.) TaxID=251538 RepID=A0ABY4STT3_9ENTR|nr:alpha/beta fold hydrolase [Candidatus Blochmannia ocreatus]URJ25382.1 alpha/beta fold hydrolase [Candidatus Blochmannia ocreatus]